MGAGRYDRRETGGTYERVAGTVAIDDSGCRVSVPDPKRRQATGSHSGGPVSAVYDSKDGTVPDERAFGQPQGVVAFKAEPDGICVGKSAKVTVRPGKTSAGFRHRVRQRLRHGRQRAAGYGQPVRDEG